MNQIKWIFFDVGSTLIDETEAYNHRIREAIEGTEITFEEFQEKRKEFAKQNKKGDLEAIQFFGLKKTPWRKEDEIPYPDAERVLCELRNRGYLIGVIANQSPGTADRLEKWGLSEFISVICASAEEGIAKPDLQFFRRAFTLAGCRAEESVMVGDRIDNDICPANRLGMTTVWIKQGFSAYHSPRNSDETPDYTIESLSELLELF